jgi:tetratricopeptide (TPR) repeat protein
VAIWALCALGANAQTQADLLMRCKSPGVDIAASVRACTEAILSPENDNEARSFLYVDRAHGYELLGAGPLALADFDRALQLSKWNDDVVYRARAQFRLRRADYPNAIADFDRASEKTRRRNPEDLGWQCRVRAIAGVQLTVAKRQCDEALELRPGNPFLLETRGLLNIKSGKGQEAWDDYATFLRWTPESSAGLYGLGVAALLLGRNEEGARQIAVAKALNPDIEAEYTAYGITP